MMPPPKPSWLKVRAPGGAAYAGVADSLRAGNLNTVCEEARCPNAGECWGAGTATFLLLGHVCTRACRFCAVTCGDPGGRLDPDEPRKVAEAVERMGLGYVVVTSVDRDDLSDGGAAAIADAVTTIRRKCPSVRIEVLIPDFSGDLEAVETVVGCRPDVLGHNIETVERLTPLVRDQRAGYRQSLGVLSAVRRLNGAQKTKSSLMLGLGEKTQEILSAFDDLRSCGVDILTLGQYLRPSARHLEVKEYLSPESFQELAEAARDRGFSFVASGPLVRSSYRAFEAFLASAQRSDCPRGEMDY